MKGFSFLLRGRPATGSDAGLGIMLRIAGVAGIVLLASGLVGAAIGAWTLLRMQVEGDQTGWDALIGAIAVMLGALMVLGGGLLAAGSHAAFAGWRDGRPRPVRIAGWVFVAVGALAAVPGAIAGMETPLDLYVLIAGALVAVLGAVMVAWAAGHGGGHGTGS